MQGDTYQVATNTSMFPIGHVSSSKAYIYIYIYNIYKYIIIYIYLSIYNIYKYKYINKYK